MVGFGPGEETTRVLDGKPVPAIYSNLTSADGADITKARSLNANARLCYLGVMKAGSFDISEFLAIEMSRQPNPHSRPNSDVLRPRLTARDILQRLPTTWIVDFGCDLSQEEACGYESPWNHLLVNVKPEREKNRRKRLAEKWWIHGEPRPGLRNSLTGLERFIVTPEVSKHRIFVWLDTVFLADHQTRAFPRSDDYFLGVLHSRVHEVWARALGTQLRERESGFRYTPTTCFETFPFPEPTDEQREAIAAAARELNDLRERWLNPPEWTRAEYLTFPGSADGPWRRYIDPASVDDRGIGTVRYPRTVPNSEEAAKELKKRTLTNLYNHRPTWLDLAHKKLDEAVFATYGWSPDMTDDALLAGLLHLNLQRAERGTQPIH
jgi:hypothetical protein